MVLSTYHVKVKVAQLCLTLCNPIDSTVAEILKARIPFSSQRDLPNPGIKPRSPALQVDSLLAEPQGKPKNTRVGSLSLLQWIFLTQELNWGLLHCRWILYQQSYQGSTILMCNSCILWWSVYSYCLCIFLIEFFLYLIFESSLYIWNAVIYVI